MFRLWHVAGFKKIQDVRFIGAYGGAPLDLVIREGPCTQ